MGTLDEIIIHWLHVPDNGVMYLERVYVPARGARSVSRSSRVSAYESESNTAVRTLPTRLQLHVHQHKASQQVCSLSSR
jgi:hypothetical protein